VEDRRDLSSRRTENSGKEYILFLKKSELARKTLAAGDRIIGVLRGNYPN